MLPYKLDTWTAWPTVRSDAEYSFLQIQTAGESSNRDVRDFSRPIPSGRATLTYWWRNGGFKRISAHLSVLDQDLNDTGLMLRLQLSNIEPTPDQEGDTQIQAQNIVIPYTMRSFGDDPSKNYYAAHSLYPSLNERSCTQLWAMMLPEDCPDTYHKAWTRGPAYQVWPLNWGFASPLTEATEATRPDHQGQSTAPPSGPPALRNFPSMVNGTTRAGSDYGSGSYITSPGSSRQ